MQRPGGGRSKDGKLAPSESRSHWRLLSTRSLPSQDDGSTCSMQKRLQGARADTEGLMRTLWHPLIRENHARVQGGPVGVGSGWILDIFVFPLIF